MIVAVRASTLGVLAVFVFGIFDVFLDVCQLPRAADDVDPFGLVVIRGGELGS